MGVFASLGSFILKVAGFIVRTFESAVNGVIDIVNQGIRLANAVNPFGQIDEISRVSFAGGFGGTAPTAPGKPGATTSSPDLLERRLGGLTPAAVGIGIPDLGLDEEDGGGRGGGGGGRKVKALRDLSTITTGVGGGPFTPGLGGVDVSGFTLGPLSPADMQALSQINITVNTVSADANFPNLVVDALQQYNLVSGPIDVAIAV